MKSKSNCKKIKRNILTFKSTPFSSANDFANGVANTRPLVALEGAAGALAGVVCAGATGLAGGGGGGEGGGGAAEAGTLLPITSSSAAVGTKVLKASISGSFSTMIHNS